MVSVLVKGCGVCTFLLWDRKQDTQTLFLQVGVNCMHFVCFTWNWAYFFFSRSAGAFLEPSGMGVTLKMYDILYKCQVSENPVLFPYTVGRVLELNTVYLDHLCLWQPCCLMQCHVVGNIVEHS